MSEFNHVIVKVSTNASPKVKLQTGDPHTTIKLAAGSTNLPIYTGEYEVIPTQTDIILPTKNKALRDNIKVDAIAYSEVTNPSGGLTVTIG